MEQSVNGARSKKIIIAVCIVVVLSLLILAVTLSGGKEPDEAALREAMERLPRNASYVADYLDYWGFPDFDKTKLKTIETRYASYYYKELPEKEVLAKSLATVFLDELYSVIDIKDSELVTEAYAACYIYAVGDTYGYYRTKEQTEEFIGGMSGEFVGIGVVVRNETITGIPIIEVIENSPAKAAGLAVGDYIIAIDGKSVVGGDYVSAVNMIRGEEGSEVTVRVRRGDAELDFTMARAKVKEVTVTAEMLDNKIGHLSISQFKAGTAEEFKTKLDYLLSQGAVGIVFDLRSNPGGYLSSVCDVLSYLVPTDTNIVKFSGYMKPINAYEGTELEPVDNVLSVPCAVICSYYTASAGELFTGALRDFNDMGILEAVTVGEKTFQKGVMQTTFSAGDGDTVTLTTAYYYSPLGEADGEAGVVPDVIVEDASNYLTVAIDELNKLINN
ncbi:MAG: PDZ domain-containing protein [Clostridia bacterium]|nr:PDZ domain-containing protein [Clostridia bacterium]